MNPDSKIKGVFDLRWQWVQDLQDTTQIKTTKVHTDNNIADILTKCQPRVKFDSLLQLVTDKATQLATDAQRGGA